MDISLAGWSIVRRFRNEADPLPLLDFPKVSKEEFGIDLIELNSPFFKYRDPGSPAESPIANGFLGELKQRADNLGVGCLNIAVDGHGDLSSIDETERLQAVDNHRKWIDACAHLGCTAFRANSGGRSDGSDDAKIEQCVKSFGTLAEEASKANVRVMMENHGGISYDPNVVVQIMDAIGNDACRVLADFLNWTEGDDRLMNLRKVAHYAWAIHAKFLTFDDSGESPEIDCGEAVRILKNAGYSNPWGIEYEGKTDDHEGVLKSKALLKKHLA